MKKIIAVLLIFSFCLTLCGCRFIDIPFSDILENNSFPSSIFENFVQDVPQEPSSSEPEIENITKDEALGIAEKIVHCYDQAKFIGVCCDGKFSSEDLSQFLSDSQKEYYYNNQFKITCCSSKEEIRSHLSRCLDKSLFNSAAVDEYYEENLFCDNNNNWYLKVTPMGGGGYSDVSVIKYSNEKIIAQAYYFYAGDIDKQPTVFTIEKLDNNFTLTEIKQPDN